MGLLRSFQLWRGVNHLQTPRASTVPYIGHFEDSATRAPIAQCGNPRLSPRRFLRPRPQLTVHLLKAVQSDHIWAQREATDH